MAEVRQSEPQHGLVAVAWDWVEPEEGKYDFTLVDGCSTAPETEPPAHTPVVRQLEERAFQLRARVGEADQERFPRVRIRTAAVEVLTTLSETTSQPTPAPMRPSCIMCTSGFRTAHRDHDSVGTKWG